MAFSDFLMIATAGVLMAAGMFGAALMLRWTLKKLPLRNPAGEPTALRKWLVGLAAVALVIALLYAILLLGWNPHGDAM